MNVKKSLKFVGVLTGVVAALAVSPVVSESSDARPKKEARASSLYCPAVGRSFQTNELPAARGRDFSEIAEIERTLEPEVLDAATARELYETAAMEGEPRLLYRYKSARLTAYQLQGCGFCHGHRDYKLYNSDLFFQQDSDEFSGQTDPASLFHKIPNPQNWLMPADGIVDALSAFDTNDSSGTLTIVDAYRDRVTYKLESAGTAPVDFLKVVESRPYGSESAFVMEDASIVSPIPGVEYTLEPALRDHYTVRERLIPAWIDTETFVSLPSNLKRKKLGIGEDVTLSLIAPSDATVTWAIISGQGTLSVISGGGPRKRKFTASGQEGSVVVEATLANYFQAKTRVEFTVIAPKTVFFERESGGITIETNPDGIFMRVLAPYYFGPDDVNFHKVQPGEGTAPPVRTGWFVGNALSNKSHTAWMANYTLSEEVVAGKGTRGPTPDQVNLSAQPPPVINQTGRFEWHIPWLYRLDGTTGPGTPFTTTIQWFEIIPAPPGQGMNGYTGKGGKGNMTVEP